MDDFNAFWTAYPRKVGKALCRAKFAKITGVGLSVMVEGERLLLRASADDLVKAAKAFSVTTDEEKRFIPHPATWLNQGRFEDMDEDERDRNAAFYDRCQEARQAHKLKVVK